MTLISPGSAFEAKVFTDFAVCSRCVQLGKERSMQSLDFMFNRFL